MYFKLKDIEYEILNCSVSLNYEDTGIRMYIEVNAELHQPVARRAEEKVAGTS